MLPDASGANYDRDDGDTEHFVMQGEHWDVVCLSRSALRKGRVVNKYKIFSRAPEHHFPLFSRFSKVVHTTPSVSFAIKFPAPNARIHVESVAVGGKSKLNGRLWP